MSDQPLQDPILDTLWEQLCDLTDEQRARLVGWVHSNWCKDCGREAGDNEHFGDDRCHHCDDRVREMYGPGHSDGWDAV